MWLIILTTLFEILFDCVEIHGVSPLTSFFPMNDLTLWYISVF